MIYFKFASNDNNRSYVQLSKANYQHLLFYYRLFIHEIHSVANKEDLKLQNSYNSN